MGKLNSEQREKVGSNCISAQVNNSNKKQVVVYCTDKSAGLAVKGAIAAAYPSYKFYKAENIALNTAGHLILGVFTLGASSAVQAASQTWKNFSVMTGSADNAKKLVQEIDSCINEYGGYSEGAGNYDGGNDYNGNNASGGKGISKTTIYVIAGVLVAVVLAIVLTRKKTK